VPGTEPNRRNDATRLSGLRLVIVALSLVGLITTYAAVELFRYGGLATGLRGAIAASQERQTNLAGLTRAVQDLARADAALSAQPAVIPELTTLKTAQAVIAGWTDPPDLQRAERDRLMPLLDAWQAGLSARADAARATGMSPQTPPALIQSEAALTAILHGMADFEAAETARFQTLWGNASREVSRVLSLTLAAIVVLVALVVLRSLSYLHWRDRTEAALRRAGQEAERANAAKSEFLATVSHEIRTPLTGVLGYADLLLSTDPRADQKPRLERLRQAGETLNALIDDLLELSRIEAGRIDTRPAPFDLPALLDRVVALVEPVATAKRLHLKLNADPALPRHVTGDAKRITQVLLNLLNNAVKFTESGAVMLDVAADGDRIALTVADTGIGIASEDLPKLFRRFSQIDASNSRSYGGTGLGLAISKGLVEAMGGQIGVTSTPGAGSAFRVVLPLPAAEEAEQPAHPAPVAAGGAQILVAEDSAQNQDIIRTVLERAGHRVTIAADGIEALAAATGTRFDLVVMDMQMPRMDGTEATAAIRALPAPHGQVPILALSANVMADQIAAIRAAGADAHLAKPFAAQGLLAACASLLPETPEQDPAPPRPVASDDLEALVALMGRDWVAQRMAALLAGLAWIDTPPDPPTAAVGAMRQPAHRLVSEAGQLGLADLSLAASALEQAILSGADTGSALARLAAEASRARAEAPRLMARIEAR
jgi:signal transduction histidine kinase/ActR/RegA family two-component response regulator/HPt (histidine-containing phosphotransfer) domain-containing protein